MTCAQGSFLVSHDLCPRVVSGRLRSLAGEADSSALAEALAGIFAIHTHVPVLLPIITVRMRLLLLGLRGLAFLGLDSVRLLGHKLPVQSVQGRVSRALLALLPLSGPVCVQSAALLVVLNRADIVCLEKLIITIGRAGA